MRLRIAPKFVARVSAVLMLTASLVCASVSTGRHGINIDSAFAKQESERNVDDQPPKFPLDEFSARSSPARCSAMMGLSN